MRNPRLAAVTWRGGLTLIELLVVISVIAGLVGLLLPATTLVRTVVKSSVCANQLRQIHLAIGGYGNDNDGNLPAGWTNPAENISWDDLLSPYDGRDLQRNGSSVTGLNMATTWLNTGTVSASSLKYYMLYSCPAAEMSRRGPILGGVVSPAYFARTYGFTGWKSASAGNGYYDASTLPGAYNQGIGSAYQDWAGNSHRVVRPAEKILLLEVLYVYNALGRVDYSSVAKPEDQANYSNPAQYASYYGVDAAPLHRSRWNYLFFDGHINLLGPNETKDPGKSGTYPGTMWRYGE